MVRSHPPQLVINKVPLVGIFVYNGRWKEITRCGVADGVLGHGLFIMNLPMQLWEQFPQTKMAAYVFGDTRLSVVWLTLRLYVGWLWLSAGWAKVMNPVWVGTEAGGAVTGFLRGALTKTVGEHPDVSSGYAWFVENIALPQASLFSHLVAFGELAVGVALILGVVVGVAAFFGAFMNVNYLMAGTVSANPEMLLVQIFLILAWRTAGWYGLDRFFLPYWSERKRRLVSQ